MKKYMIIHYRETDKIGVKYDRDVKEIEEKDIFDEIDHAHKNNHKIVIWELGKCVLDWT